MPVKPKPTQQRKELDRMSEQGVNLVLAKHIRSLLEDTFQLKVLDGPNNELTFSKPVTVGYMDDEARTGRRWFRIRFEELGA